MVKKAKYDVVIIGGSFAGLSAAMSLGRSMRDVLIIDAGKPCNKGVKEAHNIITQDGEAPDGIRKTALKNVLQYETIEQVCDMVDDIKGEDGKFVVYLHSGERIECRKILFASGLKDELPEIEGYRECWGKSIVHCPYCHGYETRGQKVGVLSNGPKAFAFVRLIHHWAPDLRFYTNEAAYLAPEELEKLRDKGIFMCEKKVVKFEHTDGMLERIVFEDGTSDEINFLFSAPVTVQSTDLPEKLGCMLTKENQLQVNEQQETTVKGVYGAGDNTASFRAVVVSMASGNQAGVLINNQLIQEEF
ncbi:MAG: NAD(P)/FAD-dependent oxidoreductase [Candidatus Gracilibacteria bacterium]